MTRLEKAGLNLDGNRIQLAPQSKSSPLKEETKLPVYNPRIHKRGDLVRKFHGGKWVEVIVPGLDGEGNPIPEM